MYSVILLDREIRPHMTLEPPADSRLYDKLDTAKRATLDILSLSIAIVKYMLDKRRVRIQEISLSPQNKPHTPRETLVE